MLLEAGSSFRMASTDGAGSALLAIKPYGHRIGNCGNHWERGHRCRKETRAEPATEEAIRAEIEEMGRLTPEQEDILYNISLKQDELGRESTNLLMEKVEGQPPLRAHDRARVPRTYDVFNHGGKHDEACRDVTLKGLRYCIMLSADELSARRKLNPARRASEAGLRAPSCRPRARTSGADRQTSSRESARAASAGLSRSARRAGRRCHALRRAQGDVDEVASPSSPVSYTRKHLWSCTGSPSGRR